MVSRRVLLVDDDLKRPPASGEDSPARIGYMGYYVQQLCMVYSDVVSVRGPDAALEELEKNPRFDLVILDVMMPPGRAFGKEETEDGLRTGVCLAKQIHEKYPGLVIVFLSNVVPPESVDEKGEFQALLDNGTVKHLLLKPDYRPLALIDKLNEVLGS